MAPSPFYLQVHEELFGCFSFVDLAKGLGAVSSGGAEATALEELRCALAGATPALSDEEFAQRQALLRERLARIEARPLQL